MDHAQLQTRFEEELLRFERVLGFIQKCEEMKGRFSAAVVTKVVTDYQERSLEIAGSILLLQPDLESALMALRAERDQIERGVETSRLTLEELELRLAIGQIEQDDFDAEASRFQGDIEAADQQSLLIDQDIDGYSDLLRRWNEAGQAAGVLQAA